MKNNIIQIFIFIFSLLLLTVGVSFAYFTANITGSEETTTITVTGGTMNIIYNGGSNINAVNLVPKNEAFATKTFTVAGNNTTNIEMLYQLNLVVETNTFTEEALKYKLISTNTNNNGKIIPSILELTNIGTGTKIINLGIGEFTTPTNGDKVHTYKLELYFPDTGEEQNEDQEKSFKLYINIKNVDYIGFNEEKGVNKPILFSGMTPIKWEGTTEVETTPQDPNWYNYNEQRWANAKTLDGSYWVWIPRYAYKITSGYNSSTTGTIDVKFLKGKTNNTPDNTTIQYTGYEVGTKDTSMHYFSHPTFQINGGELGFWVAKFEPTAAEGIASGVEEGSCDILDNVITKTVKIEPNATSWRCLSISTAYTLSLNMKNQTAIYGWISEEVDTHMMTNLEWGAVAYLSKSKYGSNTEEVWNNAYNKYQTGCSGVGVNASNESTCIEYHTENGQKASTTHNISGVYDMSGGSWERVMGNYNNLSSSSGLTIQSLSEFDNKYITRYETLTEELLGGTGMKYDSYKYGDGIYETSNDAARYNGITWIGTEVSSWFGDYSRLPYQI